MDQLLLAILRERLHNCNRRNLQAASVTLSLATHYAQTESKVRNYIANFAA